MTLEQLPPSSINNSRSILASIVKKAKKYSFNLHSNIESMTGLDIDVQPSDMGMEPEDKYEE